MKIGKIIVIFILSSILIHASIAGERSKNKLGKKAMKKLRKESVKDRKGGRTKLNEGIKGHEENDGSSHDEADRPGEEQKAGAVYMIDYTNSCSGVNTIGMKRLWLVTKLKTLSSYFIRNCLIECGVYSAVVHKDEKSDNGDVIKISTMKNESKVWQHRKWPWMAMIKNNTHFLCNGILIRKNFILTTASCINDRKASNLVADLRGKTFKIQNIYVHNGYKSSKPNKLTGDLGLIKLAEKVPVEDDSSHLISICLPRSKMQPLHAQECAVSFLYVKNRRHEVDTSAVHFENEACRTEPDVVGNTDLLTCLETAQGLTPKRTSSQVVYFFTCKTSGYWSLFGLSRYHHQGSQDKYEKSYTYFLTLTHYLNWIKDIIYTQKPSILIN